LVSQESKAIGIFGSDLAKQAVTELDAGLAELKGFGAVISDSQIAMNRLSLAPGLALDAK
jgi:hypothetical protein